MGRESSLKYRFLEVFYALVVFICIPDALCEFSFRECFPFRVYNIPEFLQNSVFVQVSSSKTMEVVVCGYRMEWPEQFFFFLRLVIEQSPSIACIGRVGGLCRLGGSGV